MLFDLKIRIMRLGKKQNDLIKPLKEKGVIATPADLSNSLRGYLQTPKAHLILSLSNEIVSEWETAQKSEVI